MRRIHAKLLRAKELEDRAAEAERLHASMRRRAEVGLPIDEEATAKLLVELSAAEEEELAALKEDRPRLRRLLAVLLDVRGEGGIGFEGIVNRAESDWPLGFGWLGCKASWPTSQLCWWSCMACGVHQYASLFVCFALVFFEVAILDGIVRLNPYQTTSLVTT